MLTTREFAELLGISRKSAHRALAKCLRGGAYKDRQLEVQCRAGARGSGGKAYLVDRNSIPDKWITRNLTAAAERPLDAPHTACERLPSPPFAPRRAPSSAELQWKCKLIERIVTSTAPRTAERRQLIHQLAKIERYPEGSRRGQLIGRSTLYAWMRAYERGGLVALGRRQRTDTRKQRVTLARGLDTLLAQLGVSEQEHRALADEVIKFIQSQWAKGVPSWTAIQHNAVGLIKPKLRQLGCTLPDPQLNKLCRLPRNLIESRRRFRAVAIYRTDAARSAAIQMPRISRDRSHLKPMEWVAGDVHPCDIVFTRADGSQCTPKAVVWKDLATNRLFARFFILEPGRGIRREHVIESFAEMCADPSWGVPTNLYIDNGKEYAWSDMANDLLRLKHRINVRFGGDITEAGIRRARPYNPQAKIIETAFATLEGSFVSQLRGFIGGNRMRKKVENQGKPPVSHGADLDALIKSFNVALDAYHSKPQSRNSHLAGRSPNEAFQAHIDAGWKSVTLDPLELELAFSTSETRAVRESGKFSYGSRIYRHDALAKLAGVGRIIVREPMYGDRARLYLFDVDENFIGLAEPEIAFPFGDHAGAGEQQRRAAVFRKEIAELESQCDVSMDLEDTMRRAAEAYGPAPQAQSSKVISIDPQLRRAAAEASEQLPPESIDEAERLQRRQYAEMEKLASMIRSGTED